MLFPVVFHLQNPIFASNSKRKSDLQNGVNEVQKETLPIEVILKAIPNQYTTMAALVNFVLSFGLVYYSDHDLD